MLDPIVRKGTAEVDHSTFSKPVLREAGLSCVAADFICVKHSVSKGA